MSVSCLIRRDDVARFIDLAEKEKASQGMEWIVFLTVTDKQASFRAGPTKVECLIHSAVMGKVKIPISNLKELIGRGFHRQKSKKDDIGKTDWAEMVFVDGKATYGPFRAANDDISLACTVAGIDFYPTQKEIIVLCRLLHVEIQQRLGLDARLKSVQAGLDRAIAEHSWSFERYGVTQDEIRETVERALQQAEPAVANSSLYRWCTRKAD